MIKSEETKYFGSLTIHSRSKQSAHDGQQLGHTLLWDATSFFIQYCHECGHVDISKLMPYIVNKA